MVVPKLPKQTLETLLKVDYNGDLDALLADIKRELTPQPANPPKSKSPVATGSVLIELQHISRRYKLNRSNVVQAVEDVSLSVKQGEIVALTGPSGSGKSTLMHLIGGLDRPTSGTITVDGQTVSGLSEGKLAAYRNKMVGFVFQFFYLQPFLKVARNIEVPLMFARQARKERAAAIDAVVQAVGLGDRAVFLPKELSGGQMQRVAIARALVNKPRILLADEPTGNLDTKNSDAIMQLLHTIRDSLGTTMIIVTHDPRVASWADRIIRLEDGKVVS